jgi:hypothetical protein
MFAPSRLGKNASTASRGRRSYSKIVKSGRIGESSTKTDPEMGLPRRSPASRRVRPLWPRWSCAEVKRSSVGDGDDGVARLGDRWIYGEGARARGSTRPALRTSNPAWSSLTTRAVRSPTTLPHWNRVRGRAEGRAPTSVRVKFLGGDGGQQGNRASPASSGPTLVCQGLMRCFRLSELIW